MLQKLIVLLIAMLLLTPARISAQAQPDLQAFHGHVETALEAAEHGDVDALKHEYEELHEAWEVVEDGVRDANPGAYHEIEESLNALQTAAFAAPANIETAATALQALVHEVEEISGPSATTQVTGGDGDATVAMRSLNVVTEDGLVAARAGDVESARAKFKTFEEGWFAAEDKVRDTSRDAYRAIETAMGEVRVALAGQPVESTKLADALHKLKEVNEHFIAGMPSTGEAAGLTQSTLGGLLVKLTEAENALERGDIVTAARDLDEFRMGWPEVEGVVAAKDAGVYRRTEELMALAAADLGATPANTTRAGTTIKELKQGLEPFAVTNLQYGVFDAASILLREGLEAILIITALLAFLQKSGNGDKRRWIWAGGLLGVAVSLLGGILIQRFFSTIITGTNRELIEGLTALVAAVMLFYVSFWLHRKTQLQGWQSYVRDRTNAALATGSLFSLGLLSFLAVLREGAETTLFYIGIAPSISQRDLLLGLAIGSAVLLVTGFAIVVLGRRLPLKPFFIVTSMLIFYLGFKFVGAGIHALQVARVLPASTSIYLPSIDLIGLYPTWETTVLQIGMLVLAIVVVIWLNRRARATNQSIAA